MQRTIFHRSGEVLAVALAYYVTGRLGLLLAIPPGYATPIWPPAGIALAAVLIFGARIAPGILLGSFLANLPTAFDTDSTASLARSMLLPLGIAVGATLQALAGALLIRRVVGFPASLDRESDIVKFLFLGGPASCVISASVGATILFLTGSLGGVRYAFSWWTWWVGDTIGVLVVTPLVLTLAGKPRELWRRRRKTVALPLCLAFAAVISVFVGTRGEFLLEPHSMVAWAVLASGLALTGLLGAFLLVVSGHAMLFEQMFIERTAELARKHQTEQALRESEATLRATFEQAAVGIVHLSLPERRFLRVNDTVCQMTGYKHDELLSRTTLDITHPEDLLIGNEQYRQLMAGEISNFTMENRYLRKEGQIIWVRATVSAVRDERGDTPYLVSVIEDITQAKRIDQVRKDTEQQLALAVGIAKLGFWEWNVATNEVYWSTLFKQQLGYDEPELPCRFEEWEARLHPDEREHVLDYLTHHAERPSEFEVEYRLRHRDGSYRWFLAHATYVTGPADQVRKLVGTHLDITERKLAEERIREAALHDPLTGLPNRAFVFEYGSRLIAAAQRSHGQGAFLYVDLDRFKAINDLYGHEAGDRLLQEAARRLMACTRQEDLVGRIGGDEFVIILPGLDHNYRAATVAQHVLSSIMQPIRIDSIELSVSPSIGISHYPQHGHDADTLMHAADMAMYHVKQSGRANYQFYTPELDRQADEMLVLEAKLKHALNHNGFALHYQPVIDMKNGRLVGVEALVRLSDNGTSAPGPGRFIPVAEASGLIGLLGEWVVAEACRQHEDWLCQGLPPITIAINVSPLQFRQRAFAERLSDIVADAKIEPCCMQIEVTESALMEDIDEAIETLQRIKSFGVKVALDDFGTGYSSLSRLSTLPLDKLKVDQSFVRHLDRDSASQAITEAIIALGHSLKLEVIGEGIESESARCYLRDHGCDQAQGFLFSRPLPADKFAEWYRSEPSRESIVR